MKGREMTSNASQPQAPEALEHAPMASDLKAGIKAISKFLNKSERQTYHLCASGQLPGAFKIGRIWHLRASTFVDAIKRREREHGGA
jgi:hypothetical protein